MLYSVITLWSIHTELEHTLINNTSTHWHQSFNTKTSFPDPISREHWEFDFEPVEKILDQVKPSKNNELIHNPKLAKILASAISLLPIDMNRKNLQRAALLTSKGLPGKPSEQLASVFVNYYQYTQ